MNHIVPYSHQLQHCRGFLIGTLKHKKITLDNFVDTIMTLRQLHVKQWKSNLVPENLKQLIRALHPGNALI